MWAKVRGDEMVRVGKDTTVGLQHLGDWRRRVLPVRVERRVAGWS